MALKVLAVSHYQTTTAVGIVAESETTSLVLGSLIQTLPLVLLAILFALVLVANDETKPSGDVRLVRWLAWAMAFLAAWALPSWLGVVVLITTWLLQQVQETKRSIAESKESSTALREDFDRTEEALRATFADPSTTTGEREVLLDRLRRMPDTLLAGAMHGGSLQTGL